MPDDVKTVSDYDRDFYTWALTQAEALRAAQAAVAQGRRNDWDYRLAALDWENLAAEIEALAQRDRRELGSRIETIVEHLVKLRHSPAIDPQPGWRGTIRRERDDVEALLRDSPSLRRHIPALVQERATRAVRRIVEELKDRGEILPAVAAALINAASPYTQDQILTDWWPDAAGTTPTQETDPAP